MKPNLGSTDRIVRVILAVLLVGGAWMAGFGSLGGIVLLILAAVMIATSAVSFCPLYLPFGISTRR